MRRNSKGFTLIELLIVVAIIGIIAAIAIPNLLNAIDRGKQKRSMADLRSIGTASEAYAIDNNFYPVGDLATVTPFLQPIYIKVMPAADGWNNVFTYLGAPLGVGYTVQSNGKNGAAEALVGGKTNDFDCDIVFIDGQFIQWPEGMQQ